MKIRPVGAELFHVDRRTDEWTDMTKLIVAFRNFAKAPKNETLYKNSSKCTPCHLKVTRIWTDSLQSLQ
jgi:hypothetical protein